MLIDSVRALARDDDRAARRGVRPHRRVPVGQRQGDQRARAERDVRSRSVRRRAAVVRRLSRMRARDLARRAHRPASSGRPTSTAMKPLIDFGTEEQKAAPAAGDGARAASLRSRSPNRARAPTRPRMKTAFRPEGDHIVVTGTETLHHQRRARRSLPAVRQMERDRRRPQGDLGAGAGKGHAGAQRRARGRQDGAARVEHRRARLRRLPRAARQSARRAGRRAEDPARLAQQVAAERRRACARHRARRVRGRGRLHQRAPAVGPPHRRVPGHPVHAGGHGHRSRDVRGVAVARRAARRRRRDRFRHRGLDAQAARLRPRDAHHDRRGAALTAATATARTIASSGSCATRRSRRSGKAPTRSTAS